jgi:hypothetical protein
MSPSIDMTKTILGTASSHDFFGSIAGLPCRAFVPVNNAPVGVHDVHTVVDLVQQSFVDARIDRSQAVVSSKSLSRKRVQGWAEVVRVVRAELPRSRV